MEPRDASQPWPSGRAPIPAWTKTINGATYTVKPIGGEVYGIWREAEELGMFRVRLGPADELNVAYADDLSLEARAVVKELIDTYSEVPEGAATRDT